MWKQCLFVFIVVISLSVVTTFAGEKTFPKVVDKRIELLSPQEKRVRVQRHLNKYISKLSSKDKEERHQAICLLGYSTSPKALKELSLLLRPGSEDNRLLMGRIIQILEEEIPGTERIKEDLLLPRLEGLMETKDRNEKLVLAKLLYRLGEYQKAKPLIIEMAEKGDYAVLVVYQRTYEYGRIELDPQAQDVFPILLKKSNLRQRRNIAFHYHQFGDEEKACDILYKELLNKEHTWEEKGAVVRDLVWFQSKKAKETLIKAKELKDKDTESVIDFHLKIWKDR